MKNNKGITLIALVITIIVLLILAGVTIAMLTGENGLLTKSGDAASKNAVAAAKEEVMLEFQDEIAAYLETKYTTGSTPTALTAEGIVSKLSNSQKHDCSVVGDDAAGTITIKHPGGENDTAKATEVLELKKDTSKDTYTLTTKTN